jgi:hypothetical protein
MSITLNTMTYINAVENSELIVNNSDHIQLEDISKPKYNQIGEDIFYDKYFENILDINSYLEDLYRGGSYKVYNKSNINNLYDYIYNNSSIAGCLKYDDEDDGNINDDNDIYNIDVDENDTFTIL